MATYEVSSPQSYLVESRAICQCMDFRSSECFLHDQNSPVIKQRMASTAMRLQIDTPAAASGTNAGTGCRCQVLGHWVG